jgi:hypothetical protein
VSLGGIRKSKLVSCPSLMQVRLVKANTFVAGVGSNLSSKLLNC